MGGNYIRSDARPVSIKDIARRADVSPSTVSRALRNNPWIPRWTRERIKALAREMGYVPSRAARDLVMRKSWTIGACLPELNDHALAEQVKGVDDAAREHGYRLLVALSHGEEQREQECEQDFQERRVDGMIVFRRVASPGYLAADTLGITPIVFIDGSGHPASGSNYRRGRQAFAELVRLMQPEE
jgi:DNA-binding LacI/PurR family transcriptional regulator